jgi:hypothetical protein
MDKMHTDLPKTVNEALKILAYNEYFWEDGQKSRINPHPKDRETVRSLAESQYPWTEKQGKLALVILKRYLSKFQSHMMDIRPLLDNPVYDDAFRVISADKIIEKYTDEDGVDKIELRFPYDKKLIQLVRCLKDNSDLPAGYAQYDGEAKKWTFLQSDVTTYYLTLIAVRYDFKFIDTSLLDQYEEIRDTIIGHRKPTARMEDGRIVLEDAPESLREYWDKNLKDLDPLQQVDSLKNFDISTSGIIIPSVTSIAHKIAHNNYHKLWIDSKSYGKRDVVMGLKELNCFPLMMPVSGDINSVDDVRDFWEWLNAFKAHGIDILNDCSWGFDIKEPVYLKEGRGYNIRLNVINDNSPREFFENLYELHQMSRQFKQIDKNTKIIFVRNRIPRALDQEQTETKSIVGGTRRWLLRHGHGQSEKTS